jgi:hypothetical protein
LKTGREGDHTNELEMVGKKSGKALLREEGTCPACRDSNSILTRYF